MKKFFPLLLLAFVSLFIYSCDNDDEVQYQDYDTIAGVIQITRSFQYNSADNVYFINQSINMLSSDMALVYRRKAGSNNGDVWEQIPRTLYLPNGRELDYDFDFTQNDVQIYAGGNYDVSTTPEYLNNQTFRIVLIPADPINAKGKNDQVDYSDYNAVIKHFNIDETKIKQY